MTIVAAADGSALGNPGPAGWAWFVDEDRWASGGWPRGTNNMGELMAVLDLLRQTKGASDDLLVYCDSLYVINTITQWMAGWKRRGWRKKDGKPVLNVDLVKALDEEMTDRRVRFEWVKGHAGHPLNEAADTRAVAASTAFREGRTPDPGPGFGLGGGGRTDDVTAGAPPEDDLFSTAGPAGDEAGAAAGSGVTRGSGEIHEVVALERALLSDAVRTDPARLGVLLDPGWSEVGASGRLWSRDELLSTLPSAAPLGDPDLEVLEVVELAPDVVLLVWRSHTDTGSALRSSVWVRSGGRWRQRFHQGTSEGTRRG